MFSRWYKREATRNSFNLCQYTQRKRREKEIVGKGKGGRSGDERKEGLKSEKKKEKKKRKSKEKKKTSWRK